MSARPLLLGVRHHGPGSARAVRAALDRARPGVVLIEGPPEADALTALVADPGMRPPVALLAHVVDDPARSSFWPFAEFSPEWIALRWAHEHEVPARFIDLPAAHSLALRAEEEEEEREGDERLGELGEGDERSGEGAAAGAGAGADAEEPGPEGAGPQGAGMEGPGLEGSGPEGNGLERSGPERSGPEGTGLEGAGPESPGPEETCPGGGSPGETSPGEGGSPEGGSPGETGPGGGSSEAHGPGAAALRIDPLAVLAETAGYDDAERWWEDVVEHRGRDGQAGCPADPFVPFEALAEAMTALREVHGHGGQSRDLLREAHMRLAIRAAEKEFGAAEVAVVCGAWHVPALAERPTLTSDRALLKGLPKVKAELTWVPWTHRRLSRFSGYGAGIESPGWYGHLHAAPDRPVERWMTKVAGLLRAEDHFVSSAHVIEAVRLAETLAVMRGRPHPGLTETMDAVRAVMCEGSEVPLGLVRDRLVVGDVLGEVPDSAPAVPLQRDLTRLQRRLRLKPEAMERELELDLRKDTDAARGRLLHRLRLLGIGWGEPSASRGSTGTFRETWRLRWEPELAVRVAEAGAWGTTVEGAATAKAAALAEEAGSLAEVTSLAEQCLLADLSEALPTVMRALADRAALDADVGRLAEALPALVRTLRYGDVRGTDTASLSEVAAGLAERIFVGLPPACAALDADGAEAMRGHVDAVHLAVSLLTEPSPAPTEDPTGPPLAAQAASTPPRDRYEELGRRWYAVLGLLSARDTVAGAIRGRCARLLLDVGELTQDGAARLMGLALSPGTPPGEAAAWVDGFVGGGASGGGLLLVHDERLLALVDEWLGSVPAGAFNDVLPLLRRTFSAYEPGVRRTLGELVRRGPGAGASGRTGADTTGTLPGFGDRLDEERAAAVLPVLRRLLATPEAHRAPRAPAAR